MKTFSALAIGFFATTLLAITSIAGPERLEPKEMAPAPTIEQPCKWTGLYIGIHGGYGGGDLSWVDADTGGIGAEAIETDTSPETLVDQTQRGFFAGGQLGYNYQIGRFVLGAEGDFAYSEIKAHSAVGLPGSPNFFDTRNDWTGTIALRAGVTFHRFLFFAKGGGAFAHLKYSWLAVDPEDETMSPFSADEVRVVPMVGGGVEYAINCNWSAKLEYRHLFLGTNDISGTRIDEDVPETETYQVGLHQDSVQIGLNYKFGSILGANDNPGTTFAYSSVAQMDPKSSKTVLQPTIEEDCKWTGPYVGVHIGYGGGDLNWVDADSDIFPETGSDTGGPETLVEHTQSGFFGGGQLGYNYQWHRWVFGAEGDFAYSDIKAHSEENLPGSPDLFTTRNDWTGTIGLRAGLTFHHFLFYAKGGGAFAHLKYSWKHVVVEENEEKVEPFSADEVRAAPMAGCGVEYAITCHWSVKAEYRHLFLGTDDITGTRIDSGVPETETYQVDVDQDAGLIGLNYKF